MNEHAFPSLSTTVRYTVSDAAVGVPRQDAAIVSDCLLTANLSGIDSHGVGRLKYYYDRIQRGQHQTETHFEIVKETETTALIDGNHGTGHVIAYRAMKLAMDKARRYGMGSVAVRNSTHFGIAGYYPLMAAKSGMLGLAVTNARPSIAPTFGTEPMLGTNPIAFAVPTDMPYPFCLDMATSICQRGKIEVADRAEKPVPEGWVIDDKAQPMTDAPAILEGLSSATAALLPLGSMAAAQCSPDFTGVTLNVSTQNGPAIASALALWLLAVPG